MFTLPNAARILPDLRQQTARERRERDEALLEIDALFAERDEEVGARVRIDDGLERGFRLVHLEAPAGSTSLAGSVLGLPTAPRKSPMTAMSGLNTFEAPAAAVLALDAASGHCRGRGRGRRRGPAGRCGRLAAAFDGREPRLERRQARVEILLELIDRRAQRLGICRRLRRGLRRCPRRGHRQTDDHEHDTMKSTCHSRTSRPARSTGRSLQSNGLLAGRTSIRRQQRPANRELERRRGRPAGRVGGSSTPSASGWYDTARPASERYHVPQDVRRAGIGAELARRARRAVLRILEVADEIVVLERSDHQEHRVQRDADPAQW